jgi:hypothetical protein
MSKLAFRTHTVDIAYLPLRQHLFAKNILMTAQRDYGLGNSLNRPDRTNVKASRQKKELKKSLKPSPVLGSGG